jgi:Recombination endonuclease VII
MRTCKIDKCERKHYGLGFCNAHYQANKNGSLKNIVRYNRPNGECLIRNNDRHKQCNVCNQWNPESYYSTHRKTLDKLQPRCKNCVADARILREYRVSRDWLNAELEKNNNLCKICYGAMDRFAIDHDHSCCPGKITCGNCVRGVICQNCNVGLGSFKDDINALKNAIKYLEKAK